MLWAMLIQSIYVTTLTTFVSGFLVFSSLQQRLKQTVSHCPVQVMVANIRCGEILNDQLRALQEDQAWTSLVESAQQHLVPTFGSQASDLLESCRSGMLRTALSQGKT